MCLLRISKVEWNVNDTLISHQYLNGFENFKPMQLILIRCMQELVSNMRIHHNAIRVLSFSPFEIFLYLGKAPLIYFTPFRSYQMGNVFVASLEKELFLFAIESIVKARTAIFNPLTSTNLRALAP